MNSKKNNRFAIIMTALAVVAIGAVAVLTVFMNQKAVGPLVKPTASAINTETGAVTFGEGENVFDEYVDFMCPACGAFFNNFGKTVNRELESGTLTLNVHPISILDRQSRGTEYSTRAANAFYSVAEHSPEHAYAYYEALFTDQPQEGTEGLTDAELIDLATTLGADDSKIAQSIEEQTYAPFVAEMTQKTPVPPGASGIGTPTALLNGEFINTGGSPQTELIDRLK